MSNPLTELIGSQVEKLPKDLNSTLVKHRNQTHAQPTRQIDHSKRPRINELINRQCSHDVTTTSNSEKVVRPFGITSSHYYNCLGTSESHSCQHEQKLITIMDFPRFTGESMHISTRAPVTKLRTLLTTSSIHVHDHLSYRL